MMESVRMYQRQIRQQFASARPAGLAQNAKLASVELL